LTKSGEGECTKKFSLQGKKAKMSWRRISHFYYPSPGYLLMVKVMEDEKY